MRNNLTKKERFIRYLTKKYLIVIRNKGNFEIKTTFSFNLGQLLSVLALVCSALFVSSLFITKTFLAFWFDPSYTNLENKKRLIDLSISLDSLENEVRKKDLFITNFQNILSGKVQDEPKKKVTKVEGKVKQPKNKKELKKLLALSASEEKLRNEFKNVAIDDLDKQRKVYEDIQNLFLFQPVAGYISSPFNPNIEHFGVDIVTKKDETVKSVLDGTVVMAAWTQEAGYVVSIQHEGNLMSIYKHNEALKVKLGQVVNAGDFIAIVGNSGELTTGPHLHFELWHKGNPVNPSQFIDL